MYRYAFDDTSVGDWRLSRAKYNQVHDCYKLLLLRIEEWNQIALTHGALEAPYKEEVEDLQRMIEWGEQQLRVENRQEIIVRGVSIGSLRYAKAALIYGASVREAKARSAEKPGWPPAIRSAIQEGGRPLTELAEKINHPPAEILSEVAPPESAVEIASALEWDAFISHASEDKVDFVEPLALELRSRGLKIWYDNFSLTIGDSLRRSIDRGLGHSKFGVVILSPNFFAKAWPQKELDGLFAREVDGQKIILPVWHMIDAPSIRAYSPMLSDRVAVSSSRGVVAVADAIVTGMGIEVRSETKAPPNSDSSSKTHPRTEADSAAAPHGKGVISVDGHVEAWEQRVLDRFEFLMKTRIDKSKYDPFGRGYWQASFALQGQLRDVTLTQFLEVLRASKTNRTGWDIGWVPTRGGIAPYPFQDGIEVWLAEDGGKGPSRSDFWRAEKIGTFSLFRGYQEDDEEYSKRYPTIQLDCSLALWRVAEVLLYAENFAKMLSSGPVNVNLRFRWTGLENRQLGNHKAAIPIWNRICRQPCVESQYRIGDTSTIKKTLIHDVHKITHPLFEMFDFFSSSEDQVKQNLLELFNPDKES